MGKTVLLIFSLMMMACASADVAKNVTMMAFDEKASGENIKPIGNIEGRDCTWYVMGYGVGEDPTLRSAFQNAMNQKEVSLIPGKEAASKGAPLKAVRNITVDESGFNAWIASRRCVIVTGVGMQ